MAPTRDFEAAPRAGRRWIVVIGIDRYRMWSRLSNAVADATAASELFRRLGFEDAAAPLLDERATGAAIHSLIADELQPRLGDADSLVLFFAGHGSTRRWNAAGKVITTGYLIPVEASRDRVAGWIELESWLRQVARLPARHILVILDSCHSGIALQRAFADRGDELPPRDPRAALAARRSRVVITSALDDERACDAGPSPGHSMFTGCLIEALTGGITGLGGFTTGTDLGSWVRGRVQKYLVDFPQVRQTPGLGTFEHHDHGELLIPIERRRQPGQSPSDRWIVGGTATAVVDGAPAPEATPAPPAPGPLDAGTAPGGGDAGGTPAPPAPGGGDTGATSAAPAGGGEASPQGAARPAPAEPARRARRGRRLVAAGLLVGAFGAGVAFGAGLRLLTAPRPEVTRGGPVLPWPPAPGPGPAPAPPPARSLSEVIEELNPFVSVGEPRLQAHEITRGEYACYLEALAAGERAAMVPRFGWGRAEDGGWPPCRAAAGAARQPDAPLTSVTFRQAEAFCRAIGAHLPSAQAWLGAAGGSWGLDPAGGGLRGPNREWTSTQSSDGQRARVCGATQAMARAPGRALEEELRMPYYKVMDATIRPDETSRDADPLTSPEVGFRCAR